MKPSSAKQKGRLHQQTVRDWIIKAFNLHPDDVQSRSMGAQGEDIVLSPVARAKVPVSIECKSKAKYAVYKDYEQAKGNNPDNENYFSLLVIKQNQSKPLVVIDAEDFFCHIMSRITW